jgi:hypothetical protein
MQVIKKHFLDKDEDEKNGSYSYHYEGNTYQIVFDDRTYFCRSYVTSPDELAFTSCQYKYNNPVKALFRPFQFWLCKWFFPVQFLMKRWGANPILKSIPYGDPCFAQCIEHFKKEGFKKFTMLLRNSNKGYESIDLEKLSK